MRQFGVVILPVVLLATQVLSSVCPVPEPTQDQVQGPVPETAVGVPPFTAHRLVVGAEVKF